MSDTPRTDAERYRWLRNALRGMWSERLCNALSGVDERGLDAVIDAERANPQRYGAAT